MTKRFKSIITLAVVTILLSCVIMPMANEATSFGATTWTPNSCYLINATGGVPLKSWASSTATTVATIPNNTYVYVVAVNGSWGKTAYGGKTGYIDLSKANRENDSPETVAELEKRLNAILEYYQDGNTWKGSDANSPTGSGYYRLNNGSLGPSTCFGFTCEIWRGLYGCEMAMSKSKWTFGSNSNMKLVGALAGGTTAGSKKYTQNDLKKLLLQARTGDVFQGCSGAGVVSHTSVVYSVTDEGVWFYDANRFNDNNKILLYFWNWATIYNNRAYGASLYTYVNYPPDSPQKITNASAPATKTSTGTATTTFHITDNIVFSTNVVNARKVTFYICNKADNKVVYQKELNLGIYSTGTTSFTYSFSSLTGGSSNNYYVYYVAENLKYKETSEKTNFTVVQPTIKITSEIATLEVGKTSQVKYTADPSKATITWTTSNSKVATVSTTGLITAKAEGKVTITATLSYKGSSGTTTKSTASITFNVYQPTVDITFNANGGTTPTAKKTVTKTKTYGDLPVPTRTGYTFDGWYTAVSGGTRITSSSVVNLTANQTLYAHWTALKYTLSYNANGGTCTAPTKTVTFDSKYGDLPTSVTTSKTGYDLEGWYTAASGGTKITSTSIVKTASNHTLYAHWVPKKSSAIFDANGGEVSTSSIPIVYDSVFGELPLPTRKGYTFLGWFSKASGGTKYEKTTKVTSTKNITLYAHWSPMEYTVTFDTSGGNAITKTITIKYDSAYGTLPTPTHPDTTKTFLGWYTSVQFTKRVTADSKVTSTSSHTLYALWDYDAVEVTLDTDGGICETESIKIKSYTQYGELPVPTKPGYIFLGWYDGNEKITKDSFFLYEQDHTIKAKWEIIDYEVSFLSNGAVDPPKQNINYDNKYGDLPVPERKGYTFEGWYLDGELITSETVFRLERNVVLSAEWSANEYLLTFDANGGVLEDYSIKVKYNEPFGEFPIPTRYGYDFVGWYTEKSSGIEIQAGMLMQMAENKTLYAIWSPKLINIHFEVYDGVASFTDKVLSYGDYIPKLPTVSRVGYTFIKWVDEEGNQVTPKYKITFDKDKTIYAEWEADRFTVSLDVNGGKMDEAETRYELEYDSQYPIFPTPEKRGFRFLGWKTDNRIHAISGEKVRITHDQTLVADWIPLTVLVTFDANGGIIGESSKLVSYATAIGELPVPYRAGYSFLGWYDEADVSVIPSSLVEETRAITLKALWTPLKFTVTFDTLGGTSNEKARTVYYDEKYGTFTPPTKDGYNFAYWSTADGEPIFADSIVKIEEDSTFYAEWTPVDYYVSFDTNGAEIVLPSRMITYMTSIGALPQIERAGYIFNGWYIGEEAITDDCILTYCSNTTIRAEWIPLSYLISFDPNGGECSFTSVTLTCDDVYSLPGMSKKGFEFIGWFDENGEKLIDGSRVRPIDDQKYIAQWRPIVYNIFFSFNGNIDATLTMSVHYGEKIGKISAFPNDGYAFTCWQTSTGEKFNEDDLYMKDTDTILYAVATPKSFRVIFDAMGGDIEEDKMYFTYDERFERLPETIKRGFVFNGWRTETGELITEKSTMHFTENTTLYADWVEIVDDTHDVFTGNSLVATGYEILAGVNVALIAVAAIRRRKLKKKHHEDDDDDDE